MKATTQNKVVGIGSIVTVFFLDDEEVEIYKIASINETKANELAYNCPLATALLGGTIGDCVMVNVDVPYKVKIINIDNTNVNIEKTYRNTFYCFQGKQWKNEYLGEYIFALSDGVSHHERLREVKEGDIIFHGNVQGVLAVSVAKGKWFLSKRPKAHYLANDKKDIEGLMVKTKYKVLKHGIITLEYIQEIINLQGDYIGKGYPFNKNGKGNEGYLFNLCKPLAKFFMKEIVKLNPEIKEEEYVKDLLK